MDESKLNLSAEVENELQELLNLTKCAQETMLFSDIDSDTLLVKLLRLIRAEFISHVIEQQAVVDCYHHLSTDVPDIRNWFYEYGFEDLTKVGFLSEDDIQFYKGTLLSEEGTNEIRTLDDGECKHPLSCKVKPRHQLTQKQQRALESAKLDCNNHQVKYLLKLLNIQLFQGDHLLPKSRTATGVEGHDTEGIPLCDVHNRQKDNTIRQAVLRRI